MRDYTKIEIGLASVVEKETGKLGKAIAVITSAIVLGLARILPASQRPYHASRITHHVPHFSFLL